MRYQNPLVANVNQITSISQEMDSDQEIYFHIDWLKPGRHFYIIEHTNETIYENDLDALVGKSKSYIKAKMLIKKGQGKKSQESFYVHEMLATFRTDDIPMYCKLHRVHQEQHDFYKPKPVF